MIHQRLRTAQEATGIEEHPDEDTICAFIEGRLEETGSSEMVSHLIVCGPCRQITAQATRIDSQMQSEYTPNVEEEAESGRLRSILEGFAARLLPVAEEDVVFAYQNPPSQDSGAIKETNDEEMKPESANDVES